MDLCITNNLMFMRHKNGYTMEALAEIISVSRQTVAKWESGESYPDIMNCMKLIMFICLCCYAASIFKKYKRR